MRPFYAHVMFRKHARLIFFMVSRQYFSQRQVADYSLSNRDFRSEAVWDTKGKFKDILIKQGWLSAYAEDEFFRLMKGSPDILEWCRQYYHNNNQKKRLYLAFDTVKFALQMLIFLSPDIRRAAPAGESLSVASFISLIRKSDVRLAHEYSAVLKNDTLIRFIAQSLKDYALFAEQNFNPGISLEDYLRLFIAGSVKAGEATNEPIKTYRKLYAPLDRTVTFGEKYMHIASEICRQNLLTSGMQD